MTLIGYETFYSNEKFEEWQKKEKREIISIVPIPSSINSTLANSGEPLCSDVAIGIFVTFRGEEII